MKTRQFGYPTLIILTASELLILFRYQSSPTPLITASLIILTIFLLFFQMTVEVLTDRVRLRYGIGLIRTSFSADSIESVQIVPNLKYVGWGIRLLPGLVIHNLGGDKALELTFKDSHRRVLIAIDEAEPLKQAIEEMITKRGAAK